MSRMKEETLLVGFCPVGISTSRGLPWQRGCKQPLSNLLNLITDQFLPCDLFVVKEIHYSYSTYPQQLILM